MNQNDQQDFLLSTFREEIDGHMVNLTRGLVEMEEGGSAEEQAERVRDLMRVLHTIKGAARMMGFANISKIAHAMEDVVGHYRDTEDLAQGFPQEVTNLLFDGMDAISEMVKRTTFRGDSPAMPVNPLISTESLAGLVFKLNSHAGKTTSMEELVEALSVSNNGHQNDNGRAPAASTPEPAIQADPILRPPSVEAIVEPVSAGNERGGDETIRVRLDKLDNLINLAGELVISKISNEEHFKAIQELVQLNRSRTQIAEQLREFLIEQTPVEERSRLLGLTELFSFEQAELPSWVLPTLANGNANKPAPGNSGATVTTAISETGVDARAVRKIFDQLEEMIDLSRQIEQNLTKMVRERKNYNLRFDSAADELRRSMLGIRMLPLDTIFNRFARPVRDLANERGKQVRLIITGGAIEVDKRILEEITDPLMHMLRNAVDHGIESPADRRANGKPEEGTIRLTALQKGSHVLIQIQDDGAGINPDQLRSAAAAKGVLSAIDAASLSDEAALDLIFRPGFSIRARPDEISGRGIGMDVVQQNTKKLNGRVSVQTNQGHGTTFTMEIPLTLATVDALLVRAAGQLFAMPSVMVSGTLRMSRDAVRKIEGREVLRLRGQLVPLVKLTDLLSIHDIDPESEEESTSVDDNMFYAVLVSAGIGGTGEAGAGANSERYICYEVDDLVDEREVVVKGLGTFLEKTPIIAGASVLGKDGLALILDVFGLVQSVRMGTTNLASSYTPPSTSAFFVPKRTRRVLVVDDSLATRELERSILETAGFKVETARDGMEGLKVARETRPDLILSDVEMPNMNGFQFCAAVKQDEKLKDLPVIIVSSRDSEEDRRKGLQAGASAYIIKGQFEQTKLLDTINRLI